MAYEIDLHFQFLRVLEGMGSSSQLLVAWMVLVERLTQVRERIKAYIVGLKGSFLPVFSEKPRSMLLTITEVRTEFGKGDIGLELAKLAARLNYREKMEENTPREVACLENRLTTTNVQQLERYYHKSEPLMYGY